MIQSFMYQGIASYQQHPERYRVTKQWYRDNGIVQGIANQLLKIIVKTHTYLSTG